jgi:hypothetical protein
VFVVRSWKCFWQMGSGCGRTGTSLRSRVGCFAPTSDTVHPVGTHCCVDDPVCFRLPSLRQLPKRLRPRVAWNETLQSCVLRAHRTFPQECSPQLSCAALQKSVAAVRKLLMAEREYVTNERHTFATFLDVIQVCQQRFLP